VVVTSEGDRLCLRSPFAASPEPLLCDDRVTVHDDGAFSHLGRLDDVVKVASRRVSISALERAILAVPGVHEAAVVAVPDEARGVALRGLITGDAALADVRAALLLAFDPVVLPRLSKIDALPRDATGKLPRARLLALVAPPPRERVLRFAVEGDRATATLAVPADHVSARGHFPDRPIVPGAALLGQLIAPLLARAGFPARITAVEVATFHRPVLPGDEVEVSLTRDGDRVRFRLGRGDEALASGSLRVS
jgi:3-hydroxymyristoyl/3-hydroxydecanoyl-(acyl carrier protein) dehydratase